MGRRGQRGATLRVLDRVLLIYAMIGTVGVVIGALGMWFMWLEGWAPTWVAVAAGVTSMVAIAAVALITDTVKRVRLERRWLAANEP